jgi:hypothetical protein
MWQRRFWRSSGGLQKIADFPLGFVDLVKVIEADKDLFGREYIGYQGSGWSYGARELPGIQLSIIGQRPMFRGSLTGALTRFSDRPWSNMNDIARGSGT